MRTNIENASNECVITVRKQIHFSEACDHDLILGGVHLIQTKHTCTHNNNIIICDIYIAPYSVRSCSKAFYNIIIPDSDLFPPSTHLNSQVSIQRMLPL